jgi:DNA (cytosine-5)-methyltransferase 1
LTITLTQYEFYRSSGTRHEMVLTPLHLHDMQGVKLSFNGLLSLNGVQRYVESVPVETYSIEGYDDDENPRTTTYIRSQLGSKDKDLDVWYKLDHNALPSYRIFHQPYQWVADFSKHVLDFIDAQPESSFVGLKTFRNDFHAWLATRFPENGYYKKWIRSYGRTDFRQPFNAYIDVLYTQAYGLSNAKRLLGHSIWAECMRGPALSLKQVPMLCTKTIATPLVYHFFKTLYFGSCLKEMEPVNRICQQQERRKRLLGFPIEPDTVQYIKKSKTHRSSVPSANRSFKIGDVIGVEPDKKWISDDDLWIAYVQRITVEKGIQRIYVLWLYRPSHTIRGMKSPYSKELFLSDNCNCGSGDAPIYATDVVRTYSIEMWPTFLDTAKDFFVRQKYVTRDEAFETLKENHLQCACGLDKTTTIYERGDCLYVQVMSNKKKILEPIVISQFDQETQEYTVRQLLRLERHCMHLRISRSKEGIAENELVWTSTFFRVKATDIRRRCQIRFIPSEEVIAGRIPVPYNRGGSGDLWIVSNLLVMVNGVPRLQPLSNAPKALKEGFDPTSSTSISSTPTSTRSTNNHSPPLRGLSLFSGGGNFDRGLEDGGAVRFTNVVDISPEAVHTQQVNARDDDFRVFWGSVDDYLKALLEADDSETFKRMIASITSIDFIGAGSPCQGYSSLQQNKDSERSRRNASHLSTFCSFVDVYRPRYGLLENVVSMTNTRKGYETENIFAELIGCLVAMGYQVRYFLMDSWSYGSSQHRSRVIVSIAAPGLEPLTQPLHTHSHPDNINGRSLAKGANGLPLGSRESYATPFEYVTPRQATAHLPIVPSAMIKTCIPFPDHRVSTLESSRNRTLFRHIPTIPASQGYVEALRLELPESLRLERKQDVTKAFRRVNGDGLFPTITTIPSAQDSRGSSVIHWQQHRILTIQEARIAQGVPDDEVIIGSPSAQWTIIGNGVDRSVGLALGLSLRQAWGSSSKKKQNRSWSDGSIPVQALSEYDEVLVVDADEYSTNSNTASEQQSASSNATLDMIHVLSSNSSLEPNSMPVRTKRSREETVSVVIDYAKDKRRRSSSRQAGQSAEFEPILWDKVVEKTLPRGYSL